MTHAQRPKAIIFDWDNTLIDSWLTIQDAMNATLGEFGLKLWTMDETRARVAKSMRDSFPELFGEEWEQAGEAFYRHFEAIHLDRLAPLDGAAHALEALAEAGIYLGVVSNKSGRLLRLEAQHLGAGDAKRDKPAPDPVILALQGSNIEPGGDVWFAGDAAIDLECARNAGCVGVLVRDLGPGAGEFEGFEPTWHVNTAQMLSNFARKL
jgi:phosphoglycolate phosphatase